MSETFERLSVPAAGDERMRRLHDAHAEPLLRFVLRLCRGDRGLADDLLQETMLRAWSNIDGLSDDPETQRRWLFIVARRVAIDAARTRQARPVEVGTVDLTLIPSDGDHAEAVVAVSTVRAALPKLSDDHRTVLIGVYFRGLHPSELAEQLGVPEGTVKSRTHYALRALRAAIKTVDDE